MPDKSRWITKFKHPQGKQITIELGKRNLSEPIYHYDKKKKDFVAVGLPQSGTYIKLPKLMDFEEMRQWVTTNKKLTPEARAGDE